MYAVCKGMWVNTRSCLRRRLHKAVHSNNVSQCWWRDRWIITYRSTLPHFFRITLACTILFFESLNNVFPGRPELSMSESEPVFSGASSSNSWSTIHSRARQTDLLMSQQLLFGSSENQYRFSQNRPRQYIKCFFFLFLFFFKSIFLMIMS